LGLGLTAQEFLTPAELLVLVLSHLLPAFLEDTRHSVSLLGARV